MLISLIFACLVVFMKHCFCDGLQSMSLNKSLQHFNGISCTVL